MEDLIRLADMLYTKNSIDSSIAALIGRPTATGNIGEFIASRIFSIALEKSASAKDRDGHFLHGPLAGQSVDIKFYGKQEGILDLKEDVNVDYLLVLTGPIGAAVTAKGTTRPLAIEYVYLFDARKLVMALLRRPVKVGVATSVAKQYWDEAEVYPRAQQQLLQLSDEQRSLLELFRSEKVASVTPETAESVPFISASLDDSYKQLEGLNVRQRDLFREALESVKNGLFRSAHVMAWAAFMDYLAGYMKSRLPTDTVDKLVGQRSDNQIIRHAADVGLCSQAEMSQFLGWLTTRNRCAHPDDFSPNLGMTSGYIAALLYEIKALQARSH